MISLPRPAAILFDLDGTLLDTAPDLAAALNHVRQLDGLPPLPLATLRPYASHGSRGLLACGFGDEQTPAEHERRRQQLLDHYLANIARHSQLFAGVEALLQTLAERAIGWGIVTNKPGFLTNALLPHFPLLAGAASVISGDTLAVAKPHPEPLFHACRQLGVNPADCWYVGDAQRDLEAGRAAGMAAILADWGYLHPDEPGSDWPFSGRAATPLALLQMLP